MPDTSSKGLERRGLLWKGFGPITLLRALRRSCASRWGLCHNRSTGPTLKRPDRKRKGDLSTGIAFVAFGTTFLPIVIVDFGKACPLLCGESAALVKIMLDAIHEISDPFRQRFSCTKSRMRC